MNTYILGVENALASSVVDPIDVLSLADNINREINPDITAPVFTPRIASLHGGMLECCNHMKIRAHCCFSEIKSVDLLIVSALYHVKKNLVCNRSLIDWIKQMYQQGTIIASICTGAFLLAETGLLDGKKATTHLAAAEIFRKRYPQIELDENRIIIDQGNIICSGGASSSLDLSFYLIEKFIDHQVAAYCSRFFVRDLRRDSQAPYAEFQMLRPHGDGAIQQCQQWLENHYHEEITIINLAHKANMSKRTFERRFKKATGDSPGTYLQKMRVKQARFFLETSDLPVDKISYRVGYKNVGSFRKIFTKYISLLPLEYRKRFQQYK